MILTTIYGVVTLILIIAFAGLCVWSYSPSRKIQFDNDANIPFMNDNVSPHAKGGHTHV